MNSLPPYRTPLTQVAALNDSKLCRHLTDLQTQVEQALDPEQHGNLNDWLSTIDKLPELSADKCLLDQDCVHVSHSETQANTYALTQALQRFHPWRKGPFHIHGVDIDTEWRSDWKWQRLQPHIHSLEQRLVLDVGCGNGYHGWRMLGAGARYVIGIDPSLLSVMQFYSIAHFIQPDNFQVLPLGIEALPARLQAFDTVFSMGVLYHRKSPLEHLMTLRDCLRPGGELVLETLVIEGKKGEVLVPEGRYAKMRNVWFLPSCDTLLSWLKRCGFKHAQLVDVNQTSLEEQRRSTWMQFESLKDFLDPQDVNKTIEGLPAPKRAIIVAQV